DECCDLHFLIRHLLTPSLFQVKTLPAESVHNPYSRVLEGHHLSVRWTLRPDRARKSPSTVETVEWHVRNAIRPVFPEGNCYKKKKNQKEKEACGNCRNYGNPLTPPRIPTVAWISRAKNTLSLSPVTTGSAAVIPTTDILTLITIRSGCAHQSFPELRAQTRWLIKTRSHLIDFRVAHPIHMERYAEIY